VIDFDFLVSGIATSTGSISKFNAIRENYWKSFGLKVLLRAERDAEREGKLTGLVQNPFGKGAFGARASPNQI
jgi:hypothetical protein